MTDVLKKLERLGIAGWHPPIDSQVRLELLKLEEKGLAERDDGFDGRRRFYITEAGRAALVDEG